MARFTIKNVLNGFKFVSTSGISICIILLFGSPSLHSRSLEDPNCCDRWSPWWTDGEMWGPDMVMPGYEKRRQRHLQFMHSNIADEYRDSKNPLRATDDIIGSGAKLYHLHCAECHGKNGMGGGNSALGLSPSPALLAYMMNMPLSVDEYMLWTISEGGEQFDTEMPAYKKMLPIEDIWKIITFMRAGFPQTNAL
jgi:mono/diheme cytochrome c family protein